MLVLSRQRHESIVVGRNDYPWVITVTGTRGVRCTIALQPYREFIAGVRATQRDVCELGVNDVCPIESVGRATLVDIRGEKVRIGIATPKDWVVHRFEVFEAIKRESRFDGDSDPRSAPVPHSSPPNLPTLNVRLDEPQDQPGV